MDLPALAHAASASEKSLDCLGIWLAVFTFLVVVGLIVEYAEDIRELIIDRPFDWKKFRKLIGGVLITVGVAGELGVQFKASKIETNLRSTNHKIEGLLNDEIARANERAANLQLTALKLQQQLVAQGSRAALLYGNNRDVFVEKLRPFKGQKIEIRDCRSSFNQFFVDNETMGVVMLLESILGSDAKWVVTPLIEENCEGTGVQVFVDPKALAGTRKAADSLWTALHELPFTMVGDKPFVMESPRPEQPKMFDCGGKSKCESKEIVLPPLDSDTIVLTVLTHP